MIKKKESNDLEFSQSKFDDIEREMKDFFSR